MIISSVGYICNVSLIKITKTIKRDLITSANIWLKGMNQVYWEFKTGWDHKKLQGMSQVIKIINI